MKTKSLLCPLTVFILAALAAESAQAQTVTLTGGTYSDDIVVGNDSASVTLQSGSSDEDLTGTVEMSAANSFVEIANNSSADLTLGDVVFDKVQNNDRVANVDANGTGTVTFAGTYSSPILTTGQATGNFGPPSNGGYGASTLQLGGSGNGAATYYFAPTANFSQMEAPDLDGEVNVDGKGGLALLSGNLDIENSTFVSGQYIDVEYYDGVNKTINLIGAQNINLSVYANISADSGDQYIINQETADSSTWTGAIQGEGALVASAVAGGRLTFTNDIGGYAGTGLVKTGAGTVVLANSSENGNDYGSGAVAADIQQGTLLIKNSLGGPSAFGQNSGTVNIEAGATLGGSGHITQQVVSMAPTAILTAGDPGQASLGIKPTIGSMAIGSLSAVNGLTLAFKFANTGDPVTAGTDYDFLSVGTLDLGGKVTIDLSTLNGFVQTGVVYTIMSGLPHDWTAESDLQFQFDLPAGYMLDPNYLSGGTPGYDFDTDNAQLAVQFALAPEPSTYALFALGLLGLVVSSRFRLRRG